MGYSYIIPNVLAQGSYPEPGTPLSQFFDVLVLCAYELQPPSSEYPDVTVIHVPLDDTLTPTPEQIRLAVAAGRNVATRLRSGQRVLTTCAQGRNRSGLVTGIALETLGVRARQAVRHIQSNRKDALTNPVFVEILELHDRRQAA